MCKNAALSVPRAGPHLAVPASRPAPPCPAILAAGLGFADSCALPLQLAIEVHYKLLYMGMTGVFQNPAVWDNTIWPMHQLSLGELALFFQHLADLGYAIISRDDNYWAPVSGHLGGTGAGVRGGARLKQRTASCTRSEPWARAAGHSHMRMRRLPSSCRPRAAAASTASYGSSGQRTVRRSGSRYPDSGDGSSSSSCSSIC